MAGKQVRKEHGTRRLGFTAFELIGVLAILAIMASAVIPPMIKRSSQSQLPRPGVCWSSSHPLPELQKESAWQSHES